MGLGKQGGSGSAPTSAPRDHGAPRGGSPRGQHPSQSIPAGGAKGVGSNDSKKAK